MGPRVRSIPVSRRAALGALIVATVGCKCRSTKPTLTEPPPARPDDVLVEIVVRDPTTSWGRVKDVLGILGLTLAKKPFTPFAESMAIPAGVERSLEPTGPLVAVVCEAKPYPSPVLAWKVDDPDHLATVEPERFELRPPKDDIRWWRKKLGDAPVARFPLGLSEGFLVAGAEEALVISHVKYLRKGPGTALVDADARFDVTTRGARTPYVEQGLDQFDVFTRTFAEPGPDIPPEVPAVAKALSDLGRASRDWSKAGKPMRVELTLAKDALTITARALDVPESSPTSAVIPGSVVRWLVRTHLMSAVSSQ